MAKTASPISSLRISEEKVDKTYAMNDLRTILFLFIFLVLASCQVKEGDSGSDLFSGHLPAANSFTLSTMTTKTYTTGEAISFTVNFPFDMTIDTTGGNPRLKITVGATTRYATYAPQADLRKLVFTYTVVGGENDTDGVVVNALELNGSTIKFNKDGVPTNADVATLTSTTVSNVKVDTLAPTITAFSLTNLPGMYNQGDSILFKMTFSETVLVTGTPKFTVTFDTGGTVDVTYLSGTGSNILIFSYVIGSSVSDTNGFNSITSPIVNGTIKDTVGNNSSLDFSAYTAAARTYSASVHISGQLPYIVTTHFPVNGTYPAAQDLDFVLEFNQNVTVTGTPYLTIDVNGTSRQATYISGSGTSLLTFRYTTVPGDVDANGITLTNSINQNAGNIVSTSPPGYSYFADSLNNVIPLPDTSGIILNAIQPQPTAVARNIDVTIPVWGGTSPDNVWIINQDLNITVSFNTQMYVTQTNGTPYIPITIGSTVRNATYLSGGNGQTSLVFRYTIQEGDLDTDNSIAIGNIVLNGGVITDSLNTNTTLILPSASIASTKVDGVRPVISSVTAPTNAVYSQITPYDAASMIFTVNWSEAVNFGAGTAQIAMNVGGTTLQLGRLSASNNTTAISHYPSTLAGTNDTDGVAISSPLSGTSAIKDQAGNQANVFTFTPPTTPGVLVDTTAPTVTSVAVVTSNGVYHAGDNIDFTVTFSEAVTPTVSGSYPRIVMTVGSTARDTKPITSTSSTTHTFRYTVQAGDLDTDGIVIANVIESTGSGYVRDVGRNNIGTPNSNTFTLPTTSGIKVDAVAPTTPSAVASTAKTYVSGEKIQITVTYNEIVNVDTTGGTPFIALDFDIGTDNLAYAAGSGSTSLVFETTLSGTHFDMTGLSSSVGSITLNGGTIKDAGTNNAPTSFASTINMSSYYVSYPEVKIWAKSNFVNLAPPAGAATITNSGSVDTRACSSGSGTCRIFNNSGDTLHLSTALGSVSMIYMVFETPPSNSGDMTIFSSDITLKDQGIFFDLNTQFPATVVIDGTTYNTNDTTNNTNFGNSETHVMQLTYQSAESYSNLDLITNGYVGAIGEVIVIEGTPSGTAINNIRNYLNAAY